MDIQAKLLMFGHFAILAVDVLLPGWALIKQPVGVLDLRVPFQGELELPHNDAIKCVTWSCRSRSFATVGLSRR